MSPVRLIAWRPLLAVAVVTLIAVGPSAPSDDASTAVEMPVDRPEGPRPHRRCRGPPTAGTSRTDRTATPHATAQGTPHTPDPSHPPTTPVPDYHRSRRPVQAPPFADTDVLEPPIHDRTTSATTPAVPDQPERLSGIGRIRCPGSLDYATDAGTVIVRWVQHGAGSSGKVVTSGRVRSSIIEGSRNGQRTFPKRAGQATRW